MRIPSPTQAAISYKHVLYQDGQRSEFRPCEALLAMALTWSAGGTATVFVYLAVVFFRAGHTPGLLIASALLLGAVLFVGFATWAWLNRNVSLTVEADGSVVYGKKTLCAAGTVRSVRIADARSGEWGECEVFLETDGEKLVPLPLWFITEKTRADAYPLARALAAALGVALTESA